MITELINEKTLKITLDFEDMKSMDITFESIDYTDLKTRKALLRLLEKGKAKTGFKPQEQKLFIEVYPMECGGCVIYYKAFHPSSAPSQKTQCQGPAVFDFTDIEALISACLKQAGRSGHRLYKSSLYRLNKSYNLILYPLNKKIDSMTAAFFSGYAQKIRFGSVYAAHVEEHGDILLSDSAIESMAGYFADSNP